MKTKTTKTSGLKVTANVKAGGLNSNPNHTRAGLRVRAGITAGSLIAAKNHNARLLTAL